MTDGKSQGLAADLQQPWEADGRRVPVFGVTFGEDADRSQLDMLAKMTGGRVFDEKKPDGRLSRGAGTTEMGERSGLNWLAGGAAGASWCRSCARRRAPFLVACAVGALRGGGWCFSWRRGLVQGTRSQRPRERQDRVCARASDRSRSPCRAVGKPPEAIRAKTIAEGVRHRAGWRAAYSRASKRTRCASIGSAGFGLLSAAGGGNGGSIPGPRSSPALMPGD